MIKKVLNKPFRSNVKNKKYSVYVKDKRGSIKKVNFGDKRYEDYRQHKDKERRINYIKRASGIRDKYGRLTKDNKLSPNYWSLRYLWRYKK